MSLPEDIMSKRQTVCELRVFKWLALCWILLVSNAGITVQAAENLAGTYTIKGQKGAITLTLTQNAQGGVDGTLKGGDLSLKLQGFPREGGGVLGTAQTDAGEFASYFVIAKQGGQMLFDIVPANADGDPDLTK